MFQRYIESLEAQGGRTGGLVLHSVEQTDPLRFGHEQVGIQSRICAVPPSSNLMSSASII